MAERVPISSVHLDLGLGKSPAAHEIPDDDTPFQLLVIGDFSGRENRGVRAPLAGRRPVQVDCDNLDETMAAMKVALRLPQMTLSFRELDDFHPDNIYRNTEFFRDLAETPPPSRPLEVKPGRSLLDQIVEAKEPEVAAPAKSGDPLKDFIAKATAAHLDRVDPDKQQWQSRMTALANEQMREVLHHEAFQAVEGAWRGVQMLVQRLEPDSTLRLYLLDATLGELLGDVQGFAAGLMKSPEPWALLVGNFAFGQSAQDVACLRMFGKVAEAVGAPFLAEGQPPAGEEIEADWTALRSSAEARWLGLALPRFLLRLPYGKDTSEVESFAFEEMPRSAHLEYLWGNPALACACCLGEEFRDDGWDLRPGRGHLGGMPLHVYKENGEPVAKPCAEILLSESEVEFLLDHGIMPLASRKNQDSILLPRIQSIADPAAPLAGRWAAGR